VHEQVHDDVRVHIVKDGEEADGLTRHVPFWKHKVTIHFVNAPIRVPRGECLARAKERAPAKRVEEPEERQQQRQSPAEQVDPAVPPSAGAAIFTSSARNGLAHYVCVCHRPQPRGPFGSPVRGTLHGAPGGFLRVPGHLQQHAQQVCNCKEAEHPHRIGRAPLLQCDDGEDAEVPECADSAKHGHTGVAYPPVSIAYPPVPTHGKTREADDASEPTKVTKQGVQVRREESEDPRL